MKIGKKKSKGIMRFLVVALTSIRAMKIRIARAQQSYIPSAISWLTHFSLDWGTMVAMSRRSHLFSSRFF